MVLAGGTILAFSIAQEVDAIRLIGPLGKGAFYHARLGQGWVVKLTGLSELADAFEGSGSKGLGAAQKEEWRGWWWIWFNLIESIAWAQQDEACDEVAERQFRNVPHERCFRPRRDCQGTPMMHWFESTYPCFK